MFSGSKNTGVQSDNSLRAKSMRRALGKEVPRTLTPYEWEQWYSENGVPEEHKNGEKTAEAQGRFSRASRCVWRLDSEA